MDKKRIIILSIVGVLTIMGITVFTSYRTVFDKNVQLQSEFKAQTGAIEANFDAMVKILQTKAQIPSQYAKDMKELYIPLIEGRYSNDQGTMMKWIQERNPEFKQDLYLDLMQSIEALRKDFEEQQKKMLAIVEQHDNLRQEFWSSIFLSDDVKPLEYKVISSTYTKDVMDKGIEDNFLLFDK